MVRYSLPLFASLGLVSFLFMGGIYTTAFELPELDYEKDDLEPYISEEVRGQHV